MNDKWLVGLIFPVVALAGCATGEQYAANAYTAGQVNTKQKATPINIIAVLPAKVKVENKQGKQAAMIAGGILGALAGGAIGNATGGTNTTTGAVAGAGVGAAAGALVPGDVLVDGVTITYTEKAGTFSSTQVGKMCEFRAGKSVLISMSQNETRIQPNAECPVEAKKS